MNRFGEKLRHLRLRHGYTARELADLLAVSHTHILRMEKGEKGPSATLLLRLSQVFHISSDKLLHDEMEVDD